MMRAGYSRAEGSELKERGGSDHYLVQSCGEISKSCLAILRS